MRSFGRRRRRGGGDDSSDDSESEDPKYMGRRNIPRRSRNAYPNYRIDLQQEDENFLGNEGARPSSTVGNSRLRTGSSQPQNILTIDHLKVITFTSMRNREAGATSQPRNEEGRPSSLSSQRGRDSGRCKGRGQGKGRERGGASSKGKPGPGREQLLRNTSGLANNPIVVKDEDGEEDEYDDDEQEKELQRQNENPTTKGTILSWLIDMKVISENERVHCLDSKYQRQLGSGAISRDGIICDCCKEILTVSRFQVHIGEEDVASKPYEKIFVSKTNISLIMCQIEAWNRQPIPSRTGYHHIASPRGVKDQYDDACVICADGGPLICCETCPSTYHPYCLLMKVSAYKVDSHNSLNKRLLKESGNALTAVASSAMVWPSMANHCPLASNANKDIIVSAVKGIPKSQWTLIAKIFLFVATTAPRHYRSDGDPINLEKNMREGHITVLLGQRQQIDKDLSWSLLRRMDQGTWPYIQDAYLRVKSNSKIAIAARIMAQAFESITDRHCRIDTIQSVVYNCGIHGQSTAEMPFIATSPGWTRQGMCRTLFTVIESGLCDLGIGSLIIPSTYERMDKWKESYNFTMINKENKREITRMNTLMFPFAVRLQKAIQKPALKNGFDLNLDPPEEE
ncbi:hypothetical protein Dimus_008976 [Dionaea muscipula]